uniref:Putative DNA binding, helix-turn-helix domain containing protein n=1 Tax=viral metagenome TaxID=1070528 RepID=A0A6M3L7Z9_9ZZZZ
MSWELSAKVFKTDPKLLPPGEKLVMLALAEHGGDDGEHIFPSVERVALKTSLSERTVQRILKKLTEKGLLRIVAPSTRHFPTQYEIVVERCVKSPKWAKLETRTQMSGGVTPCHPTPHSGVTSMTSGVTSTTSGVTKLVTLKEDLKREENYTVGAEPPNGSPPMLDIPLIERDGSFTVTKQMVEEWAETFPGVDVRRKLLHIRQWNRDNPSRRKTKAGIRKHITGWLAREQDKPPAAGAKPRLEGRL